MTMRRFLRLPLLLAAVLHGCGGGFTPAFAQSSTLWPVTGNLGGLAGAVTDTLQVRLSLVNCTNAFPTVPGVTTAVKRSILLTADSNGNVAGSVWGNDALICGGTAPSLYQVVYLRNNIPAGVPLYYRITNDFNLNSASPVTVTPPSAPLSAGLTCPNSQAMVGILSNFTPICQFFESSVTLYGPGVPSPSSCTQTAQARYIQTDAVIGQGVEWLCFATNGSTTPAWYEQPIGAAQLTGMVQPSGTQTIQTATNYCGAGPCTIMLPPAYTGNDLVPVIPHANIAVYDSRYGVENRMFNNWPTFWNNATPQDFPGASAKRTTCNDYYQPTGYPVPKGVFATNQRNCSSVILNSWSPGYSVGNPDPAYASGWNLGLGFGIFANFHGNGIRGTLAVQTVALGPGDINNNWDTTHISGRTAASDEGAELFREWLHEAKDSFLGTVTPDATRPAGIGVTSIKTACTVCGTTNGVPVTGTGLYLAESTPVATSYIYSLTPQPGNDNVTPEILTIDPIASSMVSTAWGVASTPCLVPVTEGNTGSTCTFTITVTSGTFQQNFLISASGTQHNQSFIGTVTQSGGIATVTMIAHHSIRAGAVIYQGYAQGSTTPSCTGTGLDLTANDVNPSGSQPIKYLYDVFGCTSTTSAVVGNFMVSRTLDLDLGKVNLQHVPVAAPITSTGNTISVNTQFGALLYVNMTVTITGSAVAQLNGPCFNSVVVDNNNFTCTKTGVGVHTDTITAGVYVTQGTNSFGNGDIAFHRMAEVLDLRSPLTGLPDGSMMIEANEMNLAAGTSIFQAHYPEMQSQIHSSTMDVWDPYGRQFNVPYNVSARGMAGNGLGADFDTGFFHAGNDSPVTDYQFFGGNFTPPPAFASHGLFSAHLEGDAPTYNGAVVNIRCPLSVLRCEDPNYVYLDTQLRGGRAVGADYQTFWTPKIGRYCWQLASTPYYTSMCMTPGGFSSNQPWNFNSKQLNNIADPVSGQDAVNLRTMQATVHRGTVAVAALAAGACQQYSVTGMGAITNAMGIIASAAADPGNVSAVAYYISGTSAGLRVCAVGATSNAVTFNVAAQ